jgi:hypothetical protein
MGFEVDDVDERAVGEMGVFSWPGLQKETADFELRAAADQLLYAYVKDGEATVADEEDKRRVTAGQLVLVDAEGSRWSALGDDGVTLISTSAPLAGVDEAADAAPADPLNLGAFMPPALSTEEPLQPLTLGESARLLAAGLVAGGLLVFGLKLVVGE